MEADLFDHIQEELCAIVEGVGGVVDGSARNQVLMAIQSLIAVSSIPAGAVIYAAKSSAPAGYLKANGALVSRATYAALFSAIGSTFGAGDGNTTFQLPDFRGEFLRAWDDARGIDTGRAFGSTQTDAFKAHAHSQTQIDNTTGWGANAASSANASGATTVNFSTQSTGGTETRPRNIALLVCIKY